MPRDFVVVLHELDEQVYRVHIIWHVYEVLLSPSDHTYHCNANVHDFKELHGLEVTHDVATRDVATCDVM